MEPRKIKDLAPKPSDALQAMVDGLKAQSKRDDFEIDMRTFGMKGMTICFGCAATCAIQQLAGIDFTMKTGISCEMYRAETLNLEIGEMSRFESVIDNARCGNLSNLLRFYYGDEWKEETKLPSELVHHGVQLRTDDWRNKIHLFDDIIFQLKMRGV